MGAEQAAGVTFDWTITFGQIVQLVVLFTGGWVALVKLYHGFDRRLAKVEAAIEGHAKSLAASTDRTIGIESGLQKVVGELNRVVGQLDVMRLGRWDGVERRGRNES